MIGKFSSRGNSTEPVTGLSPVAWYRYQQGLGVSTGALISSWNDQSGNNNTLVATGTKTPTMQADGSLLFDGADDSMQAVYTLNNPFTRYILGKQVVWTANRFWASGGTSNCTLQQATTSPQVRINDGAGVAFVSVPIDTYCVLTAMYNGAASLVRINLDTASTGTLSGINAGGLTLAAGTSQAASFSNIQVKEIIDFPIAHTNVTTQNAVIVYLGSVGGVNL